MTIGAAEGRWRRVHVAVLLAGLCAAWLAAAAHLAVWARAHPDVELIHGHDDRRYFATAHSLWVDGDLDFANEYARLAPQSLGERTPSGRLANKYGVGMPLLAGPAVLTARVLGAGGGDGLGRGAQAVFALWNVALGLAGIGLIVVVAGRIAGPRPALWAGCALLAGSSAAWYVLVQPTMSHAAGMLCYAGILWAWERRYVACDAGARWVVLGGLSVGAAASVRMQDAALGLLFVIAEVLARLDFFSQRPAQPGAAVPQAGLPGATSPVDRATSRVLMLTAAVFGVAALVGVFPQLLYQRLLWGAWLVDAYAHGGEHFNWTRPALIGLLASTRNGLLFFAPISLVGVVGLWLAPRWGMLPRRAVLAPLLTMAAALYINAAWHLWTMGASFGARGLLNCWPFLVVGLAAVVAWAASIRPAAARALLIFTLPLCVGWGVLLLALYYTEAIPHDGSGFDLSSLPERVGIMFARLGGHLGFGS